MPTNNSIAAAAGGRGPLARILEMRPASLIWLIIAIEAALLLLWSTTAPASIESHYGIGLTDLYNKLGKMLSRGHGYRFTPETGQTLMREPGFPFLLAGLDLLFGRSVTTIRLANLLLAGLAAQVLARLGSRLAAGPAVPLLAPVLFLLHPGVIVAELRVGVEIPFILLCLCFILMLERALRAGTLRAYFLAGLVLGLACLVRSTALLFPLLLPVLFLVIEKPRPALATMVARVAAIFAATYLVLSPWIIRNYTLVGEPIATASVSGIAAHAGQYICQHLTFENGFQELDYAAADVRQELAKEQGYSFVNGYDLLFYDPRDELRFSRWLGRRVLDEYERSPELFIRCASQNVFNYWFAGKSWTATWLNVAVQVPYMAFAAWGAIVFVRRRGIAPLGLLLLFCAYSMAVYVPIHAQARYSIPVIPLLALFGAAGVGVVTLSRRGPESRGS